MEGPWLTRLLPHKRSSSCLDCATTATMHVDMLLRARTATGDTADLACSRPVALAARTDIRLAHIAVGRGPCFNNATAAIARTRTHTHTHTCSGTRPCAQDTMLLAAITAASRSDGYAHRQLVAFQTCTATRLEYTAVDRRPCFGRRTLAVISTLTGACMPIHSMGTS